MKKGIGSLTKLIGGHGEAAEEEEGKVDFGFGEDLAVVSLPFEDF